MGGIWLKNADLEASDFLPLATCKQDLISTYNDILNTGAFTGALILP
jgi:hypothetical protein